MNHSDHLGEVELTARVLEYATSALMEDFAGGAHRNHDATRLEIIEPTRVKGTRLVIYHDKAMPEYSPWRRVGTVLRFRIDEELIGAGMQTFSGAVRDLIADPGEMS